MSDIQFYGEVDKRPDGTVKNALPAWYFQEQVFILQEEIDEIKNRLDREMIPPEAVQGEKERMKAAQVRMNEILKDRPKLNEAQVKKCESYYNELAERIEATLFSNDDMRSGKASPQEEYRRAHKPCIEVPKELIPLCHLRADGKKRVSRNEAARAFKMLGRVLDRTTNIEDLRKISRH